MTVRPPKIARLLAADRSLQPIVERAEQIAALAKLCQEALPHALARELRAANFKGGTLVLLATNAAAAAKLKLLAERLRSFLLLHGKEVNAVSVRVQPTTSRSSIDCATHKRASLSPAALSELAALYRRLGDSPARNALRALLKRHGALPPRPDAPRESTPQGARRRAARR